MNSTQTILDTLSREDNLRKLYSMQCRGKWIEGEGKRYINMSSNDYLGLSDTNMQTVFFETLDPQELFLMSNPSSRLITGNSPEYDRLENTISSLYSGKQALVISSGYLVNSGVLPAVTSKGDLILADKLVHASIIDGLKLCEAECKRFNHNDMNHLETLLTKHSSAYDNVWVVTESLFSMDGDLAPLNQIIEFKKRFGFKIYLDEAHAFGVYGECGEGYAAELGVDRQIDIIIATLGKALSSCGAFVATDVDTRELLINRMRTVIFSTALPPINLLWSDFLISRMQDFSPRREHLRRLIATLTDQPNASYIIPIMAYENSRAIELSNQMRDAGFWVTAIRYPTVPKGKARIRVSLSAALDTEDVEKFKALWNSIG